MFDPTRFGDEIAMAEDTGEPILSDTTFLKWTPDERFERVVRVSPLIVDDLITI